MTTVIETIEGWKCIECCYATDAPSGQPAYKCGSCGQALIRSCSMLGCEEAAIEVYQHTSVRLLGGEEIFVDLAFCLNCKAAHFDEPYGPASVRGPPKP